MKKKKKKIKISKIKGLNWYICSKRFGGVCIFLQDVTYIGFFFFFAMFQAISGTIVVTIYKTWINKKDLY